MNNREIWHNDQRGGREKGKCEKDVCDERVKERGREGCGVL